MVKRNHHYSYRRIAYQLKYSGQKANGKMASVKYCYRGFKSRILQKPADDKPSGNWTAERTNRPNCASVNGGIGVAEPKLIDYMRKLLCLNPMT